MTLKKAPTLPEPHPSSGHDGRLKAGDGPRDCPALCSAAEGSQDPGSPWRLPPTPGSGSIPEIITAMLCPGPCPSFTLGLLLPRTAPASSRKTEGPESPIATVCVRLQSAPRLLCLSGRAGSNTRPRPRPARLHLPWQESCNFEEPNHFQGISAGSRRWGGVCQSKALRRWCPEAQTPRVASEPQLPHAVGGILDTGPVLVLPPSPLPAVSRDFLPPATNPLPCALPRDLGDEAGRHRRAGLASVSP